jgi:hypothetical protein
VYKNGIPTSRSATSADAADFGLGLLTEIADNTKTSDINENEQDDLGRGLFDVGSGRISFFSNINADIRSIEVFSPEDSLMYGGDRDFYPNTQNVLVTVDQTLQDTTMGIQVM